MSVILVIIVVAAWLVILGPNLLKRRSRTVGGINSISHFHRQLRVLEHSGPEPVVAPAFRLRTVDGSGVPDAGGDGHGVRAVAPKLTVVGADRLPRPALAFLGQDRSGPAPAEDPAATTTGTFAGPTGSTSGLDPEPSGRAPVSPNHRPPDAHARAQTRRRRRDTLGVLALLFMVTLLIGLIPGATVVWALTVVSGLALAAYVALLVRMRQTAEERERKLRYLHPSVEAPDGVGDPPVRISGRYAHPSNQAAVAH